MRRAPAFPHFGRATFVPAARAAHAELRQAGMSFRQIVAELQKRGIRTMRGGAWTAATVRNVLLRSGV